MLHQTEDFIFIYLNKWMKATLGNIVRHEQYDINLSRLEYNLNVDLRIYLFIKF